MARGRELAIQRMYGHIHMMRTNQTQLNMKEELYTDILREMLIYWVPLNAAIGRSTALQKGTSGEEKLAGLEILIKRMRPPQGNFAEGLVMINPCGSESDCGGIVCSFISCGEMSEGLYDYKKSKQAYYARALPV